MEMRTSTTKATCVIHNTGKVFVIGPPTVQAAKESALGCAELLWTIKPDMESLDYCVTNVVARVGHPINLHQLQKHHTDAAVYDALLSADARFSAVSYKLAVPKCICHVFADGTVNMSGVKTAADIDHAVAQITEIVGKHVGTPKDGDEASPPSKSNRASPEPFAAPGSHFPPPSAVGLGGQ